MINETFDNKSRPVITAASFYGEQQHICDTAIATFSRVVFSEILERFEHEQIGEISSANRVKPIYLLNVNGRDTAFYLSEIGSSSSSNDMVDVNWKTGADRFIFFGSAGALDNNATRGRYVIPTEAYRDEGMSYHYAPPSDYIKIKNSDALTGIFDKLHLPYVAGRVWSTDAIYRETENNVVKSRSDGCIAVEMELAGLQAVSDYHGFELYDFLVTGDVLDGDDYDCVGLNGANHDLDKFFVAASVLKELDK